MNRNPGNRLFVTERLRIRLRVGWLNEPLWEGYYESRRCSRDTYPESHIAK